jgi:hypothetical protein
VPTIDVSDETLELIREQFPDESIDLADSADLDELFVGKKWFLRTVTYHCVGKVTKRIGNLLILSNATWVADSGRFHLCIKNGTIADGEPVGAAVVNINALADAFPWKHSLSIKPKT